MGSSGTMWILENKATIENNGVELLDFELEMYLHLFLNQKIVFQLQMFYGAEDGQDSTALRLKKQKQRLNKRKLSIPVGEFKINKKIDFNAGGLNGYRTGMWYSKLNFTMKRRTKNEIQDRQL